MSESELPAWAVAPGLPSPHIARAALQVAAVLDARGSRQSDARESYWHRATGGLFPELDLRRGEALLIDCGLVEERDGVLIPTSELHQLLEGTVDDAVEAITTITLLRDEPAWIVGGNAPEAPDGLEALVPDPLRREELLIALGERFNDELQRLIGEIGEEIVLGESRKELEYLGYPELARAVRRVSLDSDRLGYDVSAPRVAGTNIGYPTDYERPIVSIPETDVGLVPRKVNSNRLSAGSGGRLHLEESMETSKVSLRRRWRIARRYWGIAV